MPSSTVGAGTDPKSSIDGNLDTIRNRDRDPHPDGDPDRDPDGDADGNHLTPPTAYCELNP